MKTVTPTTIKIMTVKLVTKTDMQTKVTKRTKRLQEDSLRDKVGRNRQPGPATLKVVDPELLAEAKDQRRRSRYRSIAESI